MIPSKIRLRYWLLRLRAWMMWHAKPIKHAFDFNGTPYYCYNDAMDMPQGRAVEALTFSRERDLKITQEHATAFYDKIGELIQGMVKLRPDKDGNLSIDFSKATKALELLGILKDRHTWITEPDSLLRYAAVFYFTPMERTDSFNYDYNFGPKGKIVQWKKKATWFELMRSLPLRNLMGYSFASEENFQSYLDEAAKLLVRTSEILAQDTSDALLTMPEMKDLLSQADWLRNSLNSIGSAPGTTMPLQPQQDESN